VYQLGAVAFITGGYRLFFILGNCRKLRILFYKQYISKISDQSGCLNPGKNKKSGIICSLKGMEWNFNHTGSQVGAVMYK